MQLTGIRISDAEIQHLTTVQSLLNQLTTKPKPRKLVQILEHKDDLVALPNVTVFGRRVTPIDKHKAVGRWKVIEEELRERGLPVTGH